MECILCREVQQLSHLQLIQLLGRLGEDHLKFYKLHMSLMELTRARGVYSKFRKRDGR